MADDPARIDGLTGSIQSIDRCSQVLRVVAREGSVRAADIASELGLQRSTAHRYLASMADGSMLQRDHDGSYGAGPLLAQMGVLALRRSRVIAEASYFMERLADDCQQTVVLCIWNGRAPVVVRVQEADDRLVHVSVREGAELSIDSSHGYLFTAFFPDRTSFQSRFRDATPSERVAVEAQLDSVRATGFAEHAMTVRGIRAIAAPVFVVDGSVAASLALVGTTEGIPSGPASTYAKALRTAAANISERLGYASAQPESEAR